MLRTRRRLAVIGRAVFYHPFETFIGLISLLAGISFAFGASPPVTVARQLPDWFLIIWGSYLAIGGALIVLGLAFVVRAFAAGLFLVAGGFIIYAVAIISTGAKGVGFAAAVDTGLGVACVLSAIRVSRRQ